MIFNLVRNTRLADKKLNAKERYQEPFTPKKLMKYQETELLNYKNNLLSFLSSHLAAVDSKVYRQ